MKTADEILNMVNEFLENLPYDRKPYSLYEPIKYVLSMGGKRIRPTLMLLAYNIFKNDPEKILMNAIALETYHNYTLLHDANTAILSGDSMLVLAYERMAQCDEKHLAKVLKIFTTTALEIGEGQQYDMEFETRNDVKEEEYIEMIRLKTSVLLACALKIGAVLADASEEDAENLYKFGEQIGLAFQLQDDFLDVYGDTKVFDRKEKVAAVTRLYNEIGIDKMAQDKIAYYFEQSKKYLDAVNVPAERKEELAKYAQKMMKRQY